jgi:hypothetical protein
MGRAVVATALLASLAACGGRPVVGTPSAHHTGAPVCDTLASCPGTRCASDQQCPDDWRCFVPCALGDAGVAGCYAPGTSFRCPDPAPSPDQPCSSDRSCGSRYLACVDGRCVRRYQQPCEVASDCGPEGFSCERSSCSKLPLPNDGRCAAAADCFPDWDCGFSCNCGDTSAPKFCLPPFTIFRCPECPPVPAN